MAPGGVLMELPDTLTIAADTDWEVTVYDARTVAPWAAPWGNTHTNPAREIYWHHTVSRCQATDPEAQLEWLIAHKNEGPYGLPYNFVVFPDAPATVFYLNDIDKNWPHTYGHNDCVAICAVGNWDVDVPPQQVSERMWHLSHALMMMWATDIPVLGHRDCFATACPGRHLYGQLQALKGK